MGDILAWMNPTRWLVLLCLFLALLAAFVGYGEWRASNATLAEAQKWQAAVLKLQVTAAKTLAAETANVLLLERDLNTAKADLENAHELRRIESRASERRLADAVRAGNGRLRDPNAGCRGGGGGAEGQTAGPAPGGAERDAEAGGLLSAQLTGLLQRLTGEADEINDAYAACRADALTLREKINGGELGEQLPH